MNVVKLNTDGSSPENLRVSGVGGLFCDHYGQWISRFSSYYGFIIDNPLFE